MSSAEGAAVRVQLEAMILALDPFTVRAGNVGDPVVLELLHHLHKANDTATRIERRAQSLGKGVRLAKRCP